MSDTKKYCIITTKEGKWENIHNLLCEKTCNIAGIPDRQIECYDPYKHIEVLGRYRLTDEEIELLKNHEDIEYIELDPIYHEEVRLPKSLLGVVKKRQKETTSSGNFYSRIYGDQDTTRNIVSSHGESVPIAEYKRTSWALKRAEEDDNNFFQPEYKIEFLTLDGVSNVYWESPSGYLFIGSDASSQKYSSFKTIKTITDNDDLTFTSLGLDVRYNETIKKYVGFELESITYESTGENVDIVVVDSNSNQYHAEFIDRFNRTGTYIDNDFQGRSRLRDLILDGPYYLDPNTFNTGGVLSAYKTTKYDGRPTCTRAGAILWWTDASKRSLYAQSTGVIPDLTTGLISVFRGKYDYYEENSIGGPPASGHAAPSGELQPLEGPTGKNDHGIKVCGCAAGNNFGSAVDSRIWFTTYDLDNSIILKLTTIFHNTKKAAPDSIVSWSGGSTQKINQSPTIMNNSWVTPYSNLATRLNFDAIYSYVPSAEEGDFYSGKRFDIPYSDNGVEKNYRITTKTERIFKYNIYTGIVESIDARLLTLSNIDSSTFIQFNLSLGDKRSSYNFNNSDDYLYSPSLKILGDNLANSGVIIISGAGNFNEYLVLPNSSEYNDFIYAINYNSSSKSIIPSYKIFPKRRGSIASFGGWDGTYHKTICVGAITEYITDDKKNFVCDRYNSTNKGPSVDILAPGFGSVLTSTFKPIGVRYDSPGGIYTPSKISKYDGDPKVNSSDVLKYGGSFDDVAFGGTSCACPITAGVVALYLEKNPTATYTDVQNWIRGAGSKTIEIAQPEGEFNYKSKTSSMGSPKRIIHNPYVSKRFKFVSTSEYTKLKTIAAEAPDSVFVKAGTTKSAGISLLNSPPTPDRSVSATFDSASTSYFSLIAELDAYRVLVESQKPVGFGGRNNGGNAKNKQQEITSGVFALAQAGGGGSGWKGGGGGNLGGGGGGGSGFANNVSGTEVRSGKADNGGNSGHGFIRLFLNETGPGERPKTGDIDPIGPSG